MAYWEHAVLNATIRPAPPYYTVPEEYRCMVENKRVLDSLRTVRIGGMDTTDRHDAWWKVKTLYDNIGVEFVSITVAQSGNVFAVCQKDNASKLSGHVDKNWLFSRLLKSDVLPVSNKYVLPDRYMRKLQASDTVEHKHILTAERKYDDNKTFAEGSHSEELSVEHTVVVNDTDVDFNEEREPTESNHDEVVSSKKENLFNNPCMPPVEWGAIDITNDPFPYHMMHTSLHLTEASD